MIPAWTLRISFWSPRLFQGSPRSQPASPSASRSASQSASQPCKLANWTAGRPSSQPASQPASQPGAGQPARSRLGLDPGPQIGPRPRAHKWALESQFRATVSQKRPDPGKKTSSQNSKTPETNNLPIPLPELSALIWKRHQLARAKIPKKHGFKEQ